MLAWTIYLPAYGLIAVAGSLPLVAAAAIGTGAGETLSYVLLNSAAQEEVPDHVLGRVLGVISFVHRGAHATGLLLIAPLFAVADAQPLFGILAVATMAVGVAGAVLATRMTRTARRGAGRLMDADEAARCASPRARSSSGSAASTESRAVFRRSSSAASARRPGLARSASPGALMHEAYALAQLGRLEESVLAHFELVGRFGESAVPQVRAWVAAAALYSIAVANVRLGRPDEAVGRLRRPARAVRRRPQRRDPAARRLGARSPAARAAPSTGGSPRRSRTSTALASLGPTALVERERAAQALAHKAWALKQLGRDDEAIEAYEELVERFGDDEPPALRRARRVGPAQRRHRARADTAATRASVEKYEEVFARFRDDPDPEVRATRRARPLLHRPAARADRRAGRGARRLRAGRRALRRRAAGLRRGRRRPRAAADRAVSRRAAAARAGATRRSPRSAASRPPPRPPRPRA